MTPAESLAQHRAFLAEIGEDIIVRRWSGPSGARIATEAVARGRPVAYKAEQIAGAIRAGDRKVILINDPAAVVPAGKVALSTLLPLTTHDKLVLRGRELEIKFADDDTRRIAGVLVALEIQVAG